ncbi:MAG: NifB/NifX family molybdenum-iron cluster-binding protein [Candidatus Cloacimonadaceae bacterium]|nr:NifB/NifX family molybdenum-iron cluster-binding protein [Candidatus Cloacimonadaceae bacterium]
MIRKIAIPLTNEVLSSHFGHCEKFAIVSTEGKEIMGMEQVSPPPHEPGSHPKFLSDLGCHIIIAGGMGERAQSLFAQNNIQVIVGVPNLPVLQLVQAYLDETLLAGTNRCDH